MTGMSRFRLLESPVLVELEWLDAVLYRHARSYDLADHQALERLCAPARLSSTGYLVAESADGYLLAADLQRFPDDPDLSGRGLTFIPKSGVRNVTYHAGAGCSPDLSR